MTKETNQLSKGLAQAQEKHQSRIDKLKYVLEEAIFLLESYTGRVEEIKRLKKVLDDN